MGRKEEIDRCFANQNSFIEARSEITPQEEELLTQKSTLYHGLSQDDFFTYLEQARNLSEEIRDLYERGLREQEDVFIHSLNASAGTEVISREDMEFIREMLAWINANNTDQEEANRVIAEQARSVGNVIREKMSEND